MNYHMLEVELDHAKVMTRKSLKLPQHASDRLTTFQPDPSNLI